jgi:adenine-specific DNA-methyltransferase
LAAIDDLIAQIDDTALRVRLKDEADRLRREQKFGLVFEEHLPELTPVYSAPLRAGSLVAKRGAALTDVWRVLQVQDDQALCLNRASGVQEFVAVAELVAVLEFGAPIFPALTPLDRVQHGPADAPWHTLIEADNYHALQLLEYLYAGQVDCIYIDPPYNTGARDWKYNNDYVDANDRWRHSKWLAMMRRRLVLAKSLLTTDGILIVAIDDNELYHLGCLLGDVFSDYSQFIVVIEHNRRGRRGKNFAKTNEFAIYLVPDGQEVIAEDYSFGELGGEVRNLRRTGSGSRRHERWRKFYPVYVDVNNGQVLMAGDPLPLESSRFTVVPGDVQNQFPESSVSIVWPVDEDNIEKNWHYGIERTREEIGAGRLQLRIQDYGPQVYYQLRQKESKKYKTVWSDSRYDGSTHGTELVNSILGATKSFDYPKSLYAVVECLKTALYHKKNALVLDFFAGSGTTQHALNLLNIADGGNRRCILVTNNEVSETVSSSLSAQGHQPGDDAWERHGVCRAVTWPRSKYTILGRRDDGTRLEGDYLTGRTTPREKARTFRQLGFVDPATLTNAARKREVASLIDAIPGGQIKADDAFFVSADERHTAAILFDDAQTDAFLDALDGMEHITHFYIVTQNNQRFREMKAAITGLLGPIEMQEEEKRPLADGFPANLAYFRLDFLDKDQVALGRQFAAILPLLWLRAGAVGARPELPADAPLPELLIPPANPFAVLVDERRFAAFQAAVAARPDLTHIFLVTDSDDAFQEMAAHLAAPHVIQLYRDYLENFMINRGENR